MLIKISLVLLIFWSQLPALTSLETVHPSYDIAVARPASFSKRIGGMDFLSDGRLLVSTWEQPGEVYVLSGVLGSLANQSERDAINVKRFAFGLHEPMGLKVVGDRIYVMQKQQLTELVDHNGDGVADEYIDWVQDWPVTTGFHEFGFGLVEKDGFFYGGLSIAVSPSGPTPQGQVLHRGTVIRMDPATGSYEPLSGGLRTPVGIGLGRDREIFVTDVQGDWLPSNKIIHLQEGKHYGNHISPAGLFDELPESPAAVYVHQPRFGHSPGQLMYMGDTGVYRYQMLFPDVTYGGLQRVYMEKIKGEWQGAVFEFSGGLEAGAQRLVRHHDGQIFVGGIGGSGNWSWKNSRVGLNRLTPNGKLTFEIRAMVARTNGIELEFTEPLSVASATLGNYTCTTWTYNPLPVYGAGNNVDLKALVISDVQVSEDRKRIFLELPNIQPGYSLYVTTPPELVSESGQSQWVREGLYTMNQIPDDAFGLRTEPLPIQSETFGLDLYDHVRVFGVGQVTYIETELENAFMEIVDLQGKVLVTRKKMGQHISVNLKSGMYFLRFWNGVARGMIKFTVA